MHFEIRARADVARQIVAAWAEEHVGYYDRHPVYTSPFPSIRSRVPVMYSPTPWSTAPPSVVACGYDADGDRHQWASSAGNVWVIEFGADDTAAILYAGRRHAQRWVTREQIDGRLALIEYHTTQPTWPVWATADDVGGRRR